MTLGHRRLRSGRGMLLLFASISIVVLLVAVSRASTSSASSTTATRSTRVQAVLPKKTIGVLSIAQADAAAAYETAEVVAAAKRLGWKTVVVDAAGDPTKMAQGMLTLANQNVDAILSLAIEPAITRQGLLAAKAKRIPVIDFGGLVTRSPLFAAQVAPSDFTLTSILDYYLIERMRGRGKLFVETSNLISAFTNRFKLLKLELAAMGPGIRIVGNHELNFADLFADTQKSVASALQQHRDLDAIWLVAAPQPGPAAQAIKAAGKKGKVIVVGFFATPQNVALLRSGDVTAIADFNVEQNSWSAVDQLVQYFGTKRPISEVYNFDVPQQYALITKANLRARGQYVYPFNYKRYLIAKWKRQFSNFR